MRKRPKRTKKSLKGKILQIVWGDAWFTTDYKTAENMEAEDEKPVISHGLCISDTSRGIGLGQDACPTMDIFRDVKFIPRQMIRKIKIFK